MGTKVIRRRNRTRANMRNIPIQRSLKEKGMVDTIVRAKKVRKEKGMVDTIVRAERARNLMHPRVTKVIRRRNRTRANMRNIPIQRSLKEKGMVDTIVRAKRARNLMHQRVTKVIRRRNRTR